MSGRFPLVQHHHIVASDWIDRFASRLGALLPGIDPTEASERGKASIPDAYECHPDQAAEIAVYLWNWAGSEQREHRRWRPDLQGFQALSGVLGGIGDLPDGAVRAAVESNVVRRLLHWTREDGLCATQLLSSSGPTTAGRSAFRREGGK